MFVFQDFLAPIAALPDVNVAKAGSAVPVKFNLGGYFGLNILDGGAPWSRPHECSTDELGGLLEPVAASGGSGLVYDAATSTYTYVWKTSRAWLGTCRTLALELVDGETYFAEFMFR